MGTKLPFLGRFRSFWSDQSLENTIDDKSGLKWHGRGHRFDPDQVHQVSQAFSAPFRDFIGSLSQITKADHELASQALPQPHPRAVLIESAADAASVSAITGPSTV